jgi:hypothetical protein
MGRYPREQVRFSKPLPGDSWWHHPDAVVLPLAGGPISRWQRSGAMVAESKEGRRRDASSLSQVNRSRQGLAW